MRKIAEVLRLNFEAKLSYEKIALAVGLSKRAIGKYVSLSKVQWLFWPLPEGMDKATGGAVSPPGTATYESRARGKDRILPPRLKARQEIHWRLGARFFPTGPAIA